MSSWALETEQQTGPPLTRRQAELYRFLLWHVGCYGYFPTLEEVANAHGLRSVATVHKHFSNLEKKGYLRRDFNRARALEITDLAPPSQTQARCPTCGQGIR